MSRVATIRLSSHEAHLAMMAIETELEFLQRPRPGANIEGLDSLIEQQIALHGRLCKVVPKLVITE